MAQEKKPADTKAKKKTEVDEERPEKKTSAPKTAPKKAAIEEPKHAKKEEAAEKTVHKAPAPKEPDRKETPAHAHTHQEKKEEKTEAPKKKEEKAPEEPSPKEEKKAKEKKPKKERAIKPIEKIKLTQPRELPEIPRKKKPSFTRQELSKLPRLKAVWRKSRGIDSKKHEGNKGKGNTPTAGYKNTESVRHLHPTGYYPIVVNNVNDLKKINPEKQAAIIAACIGRKKRNEIIKTANNSNIMILNPRTGEK